MPLDREQAEPLARLCATLRPTWNYPGILKQLSQLRAHPAPAHILAQVAIRAAADPEHIHTPAVIPLDGPHWNLTDAPTPVARQRLTPEHECPTHRGQWANHCSGCAANQLAGDTQDYDPTDPHGAIARTALREAREAATAAKTANPTGYHRREPFLPTTPAPTHDEDTTNATP